MPCNCLSQCGEKVKDHCIILYKVNNPGENFTVNLLFGWDFFIFNKKLFFGNSTLCQLHGNKSWDEHFLQTSMHPGAQTNEKNTIK